MSWEQRNIDFCNAQTNAQMTYIEAEREVVRLEAENAKLWELAKAFYWCTENFDMQCKCDSCPLEQSDKLTPECEVRMRELGVEDE